jgi:hypothetical protein
MPRSGGQEHDCPAPSCRVAECRRDVGEVGGHSGGLDAGEGLGLAGFVGVSDDGDPGQVPGEDVGGGVADQDVIFGGECSQVELGGLELPTPCLQNTPRLSGVVAHLGLRP